MCRHVSSLEGDSATQIDAGLQRTDCAAWLMHNAFNKLECSAWGHGVHREVEAVSM